MPKYALDASMAFYPLDLQGLNAYIQYIMMFEAYFVLIKQ